MSNELGSVLKAHECEDQYFLTPPSVVSTLNWRVGLNNELSLPSWEVLDKLAIGQVQ